MFEKSGIINLNKPSGMSSFLAVKIVRRILDAKKVGHLGTLDPLGTGVLPLAINNATKLFDEYLKKNKTYRAVFYFGKETTTLDSEGEVIKENEVNIEIEDINKILPSFIGEQAQMPPDYSAKKINGRRACDIVREGKDVTLTPKIINIFNISVLTKMEKNTFLFEIECSAGTYIRSIVRDIAYKLSTYGTMLAIIRTKCGKFTIQDSVTLEDIKNGNFVLND